MWTGQTKLCWAYIEKNNLRGFHFYGTDVHLEGANFEHAKLQDVPLYEANLQFCNFTCAKLQKTDERVGSQLSGSKLYGAVLKYANLCGMDGEGADLRGAVLKWADMNCEGILRNNGTSNWQLEKIEQV